MTVKKTLSPTMEELHASGVHAASNLVNTVENTHAPTLADEDDHDGSSWGDNGMDFYGGEDNYIGDDYKALAHNSSEAVAACRAKGYSSVGVLSDEWTPSNEKAPNCTFPFTYRGKIYYACTDVDYGARFWCANDCDFSYGNTLHRGVCDISRNTRGILGTGLGLSAINVFVSLLFTVAVLVAFMLCLIECRRRRSDKVAFEDEETPMGGSVEMANRRMQVS